MAFDDKTLKRDGSGITPVPQHFNPTTNDYEPQYGRNGASRVELYGPDGNPLSTTNSALDVQLSGRNVEITTVIDALAITDISEKQFLISKDLFNKYREVDFRVTNTLKDASGDAISVGMGFRVDTGAGFTTLMLSDQTTISYGFSVIYGHAGHLVPNGWRIMLSQIPCKKGDIATVLASPYKSFLGTKGDIMISLGAQSAPKSGAITIDMIGVIN